LRGEGKDVGERKSKKFCSEDILWKKKVRFENTHARGNSRQWPGFRSIVSQRNVEEQEPLKLALPNAGKGDGRQKDKGVGCSYKDRSGFGRITQTTPKAEGNFDSKSRSSTNMGEGETDNRKRPYQGAGHRIA